MGNRTGFTVFRSTLLLSWLSLLPQHAAGNDGWFEITRSASPLPAQSKAQPSNAARHRNDGRWQSTLKTQPADEGRQEWVDQGWQEISSDRAPPPRGPRWKTPISSIQTRDPLWEIQEFDQSSRLGPARTEKEQAADRQRLRNQLPTTSVDTINVDMFAGEVKVLGQVDVSRVAIGNGDIVRAEVLKTGELLVIGQTEGSTSVRLWHKDRSQSDFNIRVSATDPETRVRMETMVRMRVRMIEFRKSALGKLGIDWSDSAAGPGFAIAGDAVGNNLFRPAGEGFAASLPLSLIHI